MNFTIEAKQLTKRYKTQKEDQFAIKNINLQIPPGQLFGLVGPDGAGKTTTLRVLATVLRPTSGEVQIYGFDIIRQAEEIRLLIGYVAQSYGLYPDLSVGENLDFFADLKGVSPNEKSKRVQDLMKFARLTNFFNRRSEHLSGGMQKKLALCCALINDPDLLILDEPTTGVDPVSRRELWQLLAKVINRGKTIILSTPYMDEAERCNLVGILHEGEILKIGHPNTLEEQLPFEILEVEAIPRKIMRSTITNHDDVISWRAVGDRMRVAVQSAQKSLEKIKKSIEKNGGEIQNIHQAKKNLEDVFIYLVETRVESGREV